MSPRIVTLLALSAFATGCARDPDAALDTFKDCDALERAIKDQALTEVRWQYAWSSDFCLFCSNYALSGSMEDAAMEFTSTGASAPSAGGRSYSTTNVQESGVDEADLVKTDGTFIYSVAGDHLVVTRAWPAEDTAEVGRVVIEGNADGIYLLDTGFVIVVSQVWDAVALSGERFSDYRGGVKVTIVDAREPTAPEVVREAYTPGTLFTTRLVDGRLYLVSYTTMTPQDLYYKDSKAEATSAVKDTSLADWMPRRLDNLRRLDGAGKASADWEVKDEQVCDCENVYASSREAGDYLVSVQTLDVTDISSSFQGVSVLGAVDTVYATAEAMYVASPEASDGPWQSYDGTVETVIHKFDITAGPANPSYVGSGEVPGWLLNQFSMDEHEGLLRVATTNSGFAGDEWGFDVYNGVYVLDQDRRGNLEVVGGTDAIAPGETIFAVRFVDDTGYVVTFEQVDPLFVIDLADAENPQVVGELKIPGFSNYLHPMADGYLLGIGQDIAEDGWTSFGVQVSLFDASDPANPVRSSAVTLAETTWSEAQNDHHAFNYFAETENLVFPAWTYDAADMFVLHAAVADGVSLVGQLAQDDVLQAWQEDGWGDDITWCAEFRRSVIIEDYLYALSNAGVTVAELTEPGVAVASDAFLGIEPCETYGGYYYEYREEW